METDRLNSYKGKILASRQKRRKYLLFALTAFTGVLSVTFLNQGFSKKTQLLSNPSQELALEVPTHLLKETPIVDLPPTLFASAPMTAETSPGLEGLLTQNFSFQHLDYLDSLVHQQLMKNDHLNALQAELSAKAQTIAEMEEAHALFQAELDNAYKDLAQLQNRVEGFPLIIENERLAKEHELEKKEIQLVEVQKRAEATRLAQLADIQALNEKNSQYKKIIEENSLFVTNLEEELRIRMAVEDKADDHFDLQKTRQELVDLQNSYQQERELRLANEAALNQKEDLLTQLAETLRTQKSVLHTLEQARLSLVEELTATKRQYADYHSEIAAIAHLSPKSLGEQTSLSLLQPKVHVVNKGETLSAISMQYYGTTKRWDDIYEANKGNINNKNQIKAGTSLVIP